MNILLNFSHQIQLKLLSELDYDYYIPNDQAQWYDTVLKDYQVFYPGDNPENLHFDETIEDPDITVKGENPDIHMPINPNAGAKKGCINVYTTESALALFPPPQNNFFIVGKGTDTNRFRGWEPSKKGDIITIGNNIGKRDHVFRTDLLKELREHFGDRFKAYGRGVGCDDFVPHTELQEVLKEASVFVNLAYNSVSPNSVVEAMSVGVPIVTVYSTTITDYITHNYDAIITDSVVKAVEKLLDNGSMMEKFSINARKKALGKYDKEEYLQRWENLFQLIYKAKKEIE